MIKRHQGKPGPLQGKALPIEKYSIQFESKISV